MARVMVKPVQFPGSQAVRTALGFALKASVVAERGLSRLTLRVHAWHAALDPELPDRVALAFKDADNR